MIDNLQKLTTWIFSIDHSPFAIHQIATASMEKELNIRMADEDDINIIGWLAQQIWPVAYKDILNKAELEYMLQLIYSPDSLKQQMQLNHQFLIAELEHEPVGFASYSPVTEPGVFKLQKLYVLPELHGKGLGKALLDSVTEEVLSLEAKTLRLNMNRQNEARGFYERNGFTIVGQEDVDLGNNYYMRDYVMEKTVGE